MSGERQPSGRGSSLAAFACLLAALAAACSSPEPPERLPRLPPVLHWSPMTADTVASLRGLSVPAPGVVWASGTGGTWIRSENGGGSWKSGVIPGAEDLDLRDVEAFDAKVAFAMAAGPGESSRIFKTVDGGITWELQLALPPGPGFLDGLAFWDRESGLAYGDPVEGSFQVLRTRDGGASWQAVSDLPPALAHEASFAASGTGIAVAPGETPGAGRAWFGTGGASTARVFASEDGGESWRVAPALPFAAGAPSRGIFSLTFAGNLGWAVGGDYQAPEETRGNIAVSRDGGASWQEISGPPPGGYRSAVAVLPGSDGRLLATTGTSGSDVSSDGGESWTSFAPGQPFNALAFDPSGATLWAVGPDGRVGRLRLVPPEER